MSNSERTKKKALILFGLLFLVFGGGVSVYFMSSGIEDLKGFDKKSKFSYGFDFKKAVSPFFEALGFTDGEDVRKKSEIRLVSEEEFEDLKYAASASAAASVGSKSKSKSKSKDSKYRGPKGKLSSKNRGLKRGGKSGSKSSLGKSRFSQGGSKGDVSISKANLAALKKAESAKAYAAMKRTNNLLAQTNRTNSSMEAKSKWGKSFRGEGAATGKMSYKGKGVELDELSSSVLDLKDGEEGTLAIPEVGAPKRDAAAEAKDPALNALKDAANPMEGVLNSMFTNTANAAGSAIGEGEGVPKLPDNVVDYVNEIRGDGEEATISATSCDAWPDYCAENGISGDYYKVSYPGYGDKGPYEEVIYEGEDGMSFIPLPGS